jgi:thiol-disulfide isomerase/thioredoxin
MVRWLAIVAGLLLPALAGCIQIHVATDGAVADPAARAPTAAPDHFPVACRLQDETGNAVRGGTCSYRFGALGAEVAVDGNGTAVRNVPVGAKGSVSGSAPGRGTAQANLTVDGPKNVRITLPKAQPGLQRPSSHPTGNSTLANRTQEAPAPDSNETVENVTVYYTSSRDLLFQQTYAIVPGDAPVVQQYTFTVDPRYQTLEVVGSYLEPYVYAADPMLRVYGPDGKVVISYDGIDSAAVATGTGGGTNTPMGFLVAPTPGTYRISIQGAGAPALQVSVYGLVGLAPDFGFTDLPTGKAYDLWHFAGNVTIVDLMASWCGPCNAAMPGLASIYGDYHGKVQIVSVDVDPSGDPETDLRAFIDQHHVNWPIGYETGSSADDAYGTGWIPTMVLIDQHGGLIYRHIGEIDQTELRSRIDAALAAG